MQRFHVKIPDHPYDRHFPLPENLEFLADRVFEPEHPDGGFIEKDTLLAVQRIVLGKISSRNDFQPQGLHETKVSRKGLDGHTFFLLPSLFPDGHVVLAVYARNRVHAGDLQNILML